ncbi:hypothetical protein [Clostridium minihomine]|uniref:hypothetical protein n=1 Tax=Clostridium minihomine TaxID=2045012 RepID=UPI000C789826|nr:hypothetical protein [Clostridium minihomine]
MKSYYTKAKDYLSVTRSSRTRNYEFLKKQASEERRTALEFCIWFDFNLVGAANLETGVFSCILDLIDNKHISAQYVKSFRLACILLQRFLQSDKQVNDKKCQEYLTDHPEIETRLRTRRVNMDFSSFLNYDRVKGNKVIFPFFRERGIDTKLIAELISRELLAFDNKYRNLIFLNTTDAEIVGVEKLGTREKHFQRLEGKRPLGWHYWLERLEKVHLNIDIETVVFFDNTFRLLKYLSDNEPQKDTLYSSLHTENCLLETYTNTLALLKDNVNIEFNFENESQIQRFQNAELMKSASFDAEKEKNQKEAEIKPEPLEKYAYDPDDSELPF